MRIIAGAAKGRRLAVPAGSDVRPTADRVKEALFSSLAPQLVGANVLDLFAGSGALGLEAASRGAAAVTLVERDRAALRAIDTNVEAAALKGIRVLAVDAREAVAQPLADAPFDLVLADPPYAFAPEQLDELLTQLAPQLSAGATAVIERDRRSTPPAWPDGFEPDSSRRYGDTILHRARWRPTTVEE